MKEKQKILRSLEKYLETPKKIPYPTLYSLGLCCQIRLKCHQSYLLQAILFNPLGRIDDYPIGGCDKAVNTDVRLFV